MNDLDSKDIWLKKGDEIIGLHAVGYAGPYEFTLIDFDGSRKQIKTDFDELEKWGNEYNQKLEMIGRGSFRVFSLTLEHAAKDLEEDGWVRFEPPVIEEEK